MDHPESVLPAPPRAAIRVRGVVSIGTLRGLPIRLHLGLLVGLAFFGWYAETQLRPPVMEAAMLGQKALGPSWAWAVALTLGLALAIFLHQLAHVVAARAIGAHVEEIPLSLLTGCTHAAEPLDARDTSIVALAGPTVTFAGAGLCYAASTLLSIHHVDVDAALKFATQAQLALAAIDLLPTPPLDGGRILIAVAARHRGVHKATTQAARVGKLIAVLLAAAGTVAASLLLLGLAALVWAGADHAHSSASQADVLGRITVRALLGPPPWSAPWIDADASVATLSLRMRLERRARFAVAEEGRLAGVVTARDVARVPPGDRVSAHVRELSRSAPAVSVEAPAAEAGRLLRALRLEAVPVVERGELVAVLTAADLAAAEELARLTP